ncbi:MAG TPA: hypothetical protein PKV98_04295 [Burkholderiaceae bacterium]|nr:hypothetical protein [Burkholderiaceae bacterium]
MSVYLFAVLASASAALLYVIGWALACRRRPLVTTLYIGASMSNAIVGTPKKFSLAVTDELGLPVDLAAFPTALTDVVWSLANPGLGSVTFPPSGAEASVVFGTAGATSLKVTGKNKAGTEVAAQVDVVAELPVPLVTALSIIEA